MGLRFDLRDLRAFLIVAEEESLARAATRLNMSASPLSRRIKALETRLDLTLFEHAHKRLRLTATGRAFVSQANALLDHANQMDHWAHDAKKGRNQSLRIGYVPGAMWSGFLPQAIALHRLNDLGIRYRLLPMRSSEQIRALQRDAIELAFVHTPPIENPDFCVELVERDPFALVVPKEHVLPHRFTANKLEAEDWIALDQKISPNFRNQLLDAFRQYGFSPQIKYEAPDLCSLFGLIESGLGVGVVQSRLSRGHPSGVKFIDFPALQLSVPLFLAHRSRSLSPAAKELKETIIQTQNLDYKNLQ